MVCEGFCEEIFWPHTLRLVTEIFVEKVLRQRCMKADISVMAIDELCRI